LSYASADLGIGGGLLVENVSNGSDMVFGEANADCPGGTIHGGVDLVNNPSAVIELDSNVVTGGAEGTQGAATPNGGCRIRPRLGSELLEADRCELGTRSIDQQLVDGHLQELPLLRRQPIELVGKLMRF
jgi:hypothetical protein